MKFPKPKTQAEKKAAMDRDRAQHHIIVGRDPETGRHGEETQVADERTLTPDQFDRVSRESPRSIEHSQVSGRGKDMKYLVKFKRGKKPSWVH